MKYLLFTTPEGGYFPTMLDSKVQAINRMRAQLQGFGEDAGKDPMFPVELVEQLHTLDVALGMEQDKAVSVSPVERAGVYQWMHAFNRDGDMGEVRHVMNMAPSELENYDLIHVNLCGRDAKLLPEIKRTLGASSSIPVICNLDYAIQNWQSGFPSGDTLKGFLESISQADLVFATEPAQQALVNHLLHEVLTPPREKVCVPVIPHPCDVENIRQLHVPSDQRLDRIMVCYHRYDKHQYIPWMITQGLKAKQHGTIVELPVYLTGLYSDPVMLPLFSGAFTGTNWTHYSYELAHSTLAFEYYSINSHSRYPEECAVLGVPCVGDTLSYSICWIHSLLAHAPLDFRGMRLALKRLAEDEEFYMRCAEHAWTRVQEIDYAHSKMKLLFKLQEWQRLEGKKR
jgi:hypothetical protein